MIIGVKYGFYSDYHLKMYQSARLTDEFIS